MKDMKDLASYWQRFSTKVLWHFTGSNKKSEDESIEILKKIINTRCLKIGEGPMFNSPFGARYGYKCSCMCDIPFRDLSIHTIRYGEAGIAFSKTKAIISGNFNPVLYIHKDNILFKDTLLMLKGIDELTKIPIYGEVLNKFLYAIGSSVKISDLAAPFTYTPGSENIEANNNNPDFNFYYEREWRSIVDWEFSYDAVEMIMVQRKRINELRSILDEKGIGSIPVLSSDMIEKL
jgi:hypothetical protein